MAKEDPAITAVLPKIGVNYLTSKIVTIKQGIYDEVRTDRPAILVPLTPATVGTTLIYAGSTAPNDANAIPIPAGNGILLDGRGLWYVKTGSVVAGGEQFLMMDGGQAGNAAALMAAMGLVSGIINIAQIGGVTQTGIDLSGKWTPRVPVAAGAAVGVTNASGSKLAARVGRKFLYIYADNFAGGCTTVTIMFGTAITVVTKRGIVFQAGDGSDWKSWDASTGIFETAVFAITDAGTADLHFVEAT